MIQSELLGRHFWIEKSGDFASCPTFVDGTPDTANTDYLSEWEGDDLNILEFREVIRIYERLGNRRKANIGGWDLPQKFLNFIHS